MGAFAFWGFVPLYWKLLTDVPATESLAHRIAWSLPCLAVPLLVVPRRGDFALLRSRRVVILLLASTLMICANWLTYLWAVNTDRVLEGSLGYYINPLVSVLLGFVFLGERLRRLQGLAVLLAATGVAALTARHGLPWISLVLGFSFGTYGLLRKIADLPAMVGLFIEMGLLAPFALGYLAWLGVRGDGAFGTGEPGTGLLLAAAGPVTVIPLLLFSEGVRRLTLATVGFLQYMTPTGHFLLAILVFGEPFDAGHLVAFGCIWVALALYTFDLHRHLGRGALGRST